MTDPNTTADPRSAKPRPLAFYVERALTRFLGPELRDLARSCVAGELASLDFMPNLQRKLQQVQQNASRHGRIGTFEEIEAIVPVPAASANAGNFQRLNPEAVARIVALRKEGHSKRSIAKAMKKPTTTIHNVLEREGDPAPKELVMREAAAKTKTVTNLMAQLAKLGIEVKQPTVADPTK